MKLLNKEETVFKKYYGFDEIFNIFNETNNKRNKLTQYKPIASKEINKKGKMLAYLKIITDKLINIFSSPTINRKISNAKYKGQVHDK